MNYQTFSNYRHLLESQPRYPTSPQADGDCPIEETERHLDIPTLQNGGGQPEWDNTDYSRDCVWFGLERPSYRTGGHQSDDHAPDE